MIWYTTGDVLYQDLCHTTKYTVFSQIPSALFITLLTLTSAYPCTAAVYECMLICEVLCMCFNHAYYRYAFTTFQCKSKLKIIKVAKWVKKCITGRKYDTTESCTKDCVTVTSRCAAGKRRALIQDENCPCMCEMAVRCAESKPCESRSKRCEI